jgi:cytochrome b involved in lipid metabolism
LIELSDSLINKILAMNNKSSLIITIIVILAIIGIVIAVPKNDAPPEGVIPLPANDGEFAAPTTTPPVSATTTQTYTLAEVALHSLQTSCWTAVDGNVYDLTPFISSHPGGVENIMKICGKDGTAAFSAKHGGNEKPAAQIAKLKIGVLAK